MNNLLLKRKRIAALELEIKLLQAIINKKIELATQILYDDRNKRGIRHENMEVLFSL